MALPVQVSESLEVALHLIVGLTSYTLRRYGVSRSRYPGAKDLKGSPRSDCTSLMLGWLHPLLWGTLKSSATCPCDSNSRSWSITLNVHRPLGHRSSDEQLIHAVPIIEIEDQICIKRRARLAFLTSPLSSTTSSSLSCSKDDANPSSQCVSPILRSLATSNLAWGTPEGTGDGVYKIETFEAGSPVNTKVIDAADIDRTFSEYATLNTVMPSDKREKRRRCLVRVSLRPVQCHLG